MVVEHVETCRRLGWSIFAAVRNREGLVYFDDDKRVVDPTAIDAEIFTYSCFCPLFNPTNRAVATLEAKNCGFHFDVALIDPHVITSPTSHIGEGTYVNAGCIIGAEVSISRHVLINRGASIGHHVRIGECASIGPGAIISGFVKIGPGAMVGAGAILLPKVKIGAFAVVAAGAVVTRDVPDFTKVAGNPGRTIGSGLAKFELPNG